ncbi:oxidoreductase [Citrobacter freundii]|uniref:Oxidoreductase n=1 Tax=Citrobacter arsenatis TaxID=2546350 RepID=A0A4P6WNQ6_9ENTR|nr:oxidoreductase [Citrobacter freundii]QBM23442.1 oxidoreductase [Citrobacter arsenatis]
MTFYHYLAIYVVGVVIMFALLIRGDKIHDIEFDLRDTLITSLLWLFYVVAISCVIIYVSFTQKKPPN